MVLYKCSINCEIIVLSSHAVLPSFQGPELGIDRFDVLAVKLAGNCHLLPN